VLKYSHALLEEITNLPPPRQARQSLALWLLPAVGTLVTAAGLQSGLPVVAAQSPSHPLAANKQLDKQLLDQQLDQAYVDACKERDAGHLVEALKIQSRAQEAAHRAADMDRESRAWLSICEFKTRLQASSEALKACNNSYKLGVQAGNKTWAGGAAADLACIYRGLGDYSLAEKESREALRLLEDSPRKDLLRVALLYLTNLSLEQGRFAEGIAFSDRAISLARQAKLPDEEAFQWDVRGFSLLKANNLPEADKALRQAQAVRVNGSDNKWFPIILGHRSELELKKGNYLQALQLSDQAFAFPDQLLTKVPPYYFVHVRAQILLALNKRSEALAQFRRAVDLANSWREAAAPGDATSTQTVVFLNEIYHDFAQLAAQIALTQHSPKLSQEAFEVLAANRAASLREQLTASLIRDPRFSDRYFSLLSELQTVQARVTLGRNSSQDGVKLQLIRLELSELEDQSLSLPTKKEKYRFQNSLKGIQARLYASEVLLSFCLGKTTSYLWAVTVDDVKLYELPEQAEIERRAKCFSEALQNGQDGDAAGSALSHALFGRLGPKAWRKRDWLITEDGASAGQIPYAALQDLSVVGREQRLVVHHSLRTLPSELLLLIPDTARPQKRFVGVADPIYNLADSRHLRDVRFNAGTPQSSATLGRLAGSEREINTAAKLSGMPETQILTGPLATGATLKSALDKAPELLHFAVHVVSPGGKPQEAALALSLTTENMPELLTREAIAVYRVPGSLVILSGCSSGQAKALPSAGLIGLSRAWLLAGASAVVVSAWPIPDDSGEFFSAFYRNLQKTAAGSLPQRAATALQEAQLDMQRSSGYRTSPSFWAAYSILSKE